VCVCVYGVGIQAVWGGTTLSVTLYKCWHRCSTCITYLSVSASQCFVISPATTSRLEDLLYRYSAVFCLALLYFLSVRQFVSLSISFSPFASLSLFTFWSLCRGFYAYTYDGDRRLHAAAVRSTALVSDEKRIGGVCRTRWCAIQIYNLYLYLYTFT